MDVDSLNTIQAPNPYSDAKQPAVELLEQNEVSLAAGDVKPSLQLILLHIAQEPGSLWICWPSSGQPQRLKVTTGSCVGSSGWAGWFRSSSAVSVLIRIK